MPDPQTTGFDARERTRRRREPAAPAHRDADELFNCPIQVTLNILSWLGAHIDEGDSWTRRRHWQNEACCQSCGCCRTANLEDWPSGCEACQDLWYFRGANREARIRVRMYDGV